MEELFIPATGMAMEDAVLLEWLHQPGDAIVAGEPVVVIETDKATVDVAATSDGVLGAHLAEAGARVKVGVPIVRVLGPGETEPPASGTPTEAPAPGGNAASPRAAAPAPTAADPTLAPLPRGPALAPPPTDPAPAESAAQGSRRPHTLTPRQRWELREQAQRAAQQPPTVTVSTAPAAPAPGTGQAPAAGQQSALSRADRAAAQVARAVSESWSTIPHFAVSREIDMTDLQHYLAGVRQAEPGVSVTDLLLQATARAWRAIRPDGRDAVGLSVATDRRVINVSVPEAAELPLPELARRRRQAVEHARRGMLSPADFTPVDLTVSNLGTHGVDWFTGVIPLGQVALLTIGRIRSGLEVTPAAVRIRQLMWVTANLDHRYLDGADAAALLTAFSDACSVSPGRPAGTDVDAIRKDH